MTLEKLLAPRALNRSQGRCRVSEHGLVLCILDHGAPLWLQPPQQSWAGWHLLQPQPCRAEQRRPFHHLHVPLHGSCKRRFINHLLIPITKVTPQLLCKVRATPLQLSCHLPAYTWFLNNATVGVLTLKSVKKKNQSTTLQLVLHLQSCIYRINQPWMV